MTAIQKSFIALLLGLTALWGWADADALSAASGLFGWRSTMIQFTGVLGIGVMSVAMLLAVRPAWLETHLRGLDKMYRLHKWLGIAGLVFAVVHWLWAQAPKWLVQAGLIEAPVRAAREPAEQASTLAGFLQAQHGLAEQVGEWAFYIAVVLIAIALIKRFPHRHFFATHRWLALVYLALVLHSVVLLRMSDWPKPLGAVMALLMLAGSLAAVLSLLRRIGAQRKAVGVIEHIEYLEGVRVNAVGVQLEDRWAGHEAGQFAFVTFDEDEGAHPFTISSAWMGDGKLLFLVKALGDYTHTLASTLVWFCGPAGFGEALRADLVEHGLGAEHFH